MICARRQGKPVPRWQLGSMPRHRGHLSGRRVDRRSAAAVALRCDSNERRQGAVEAVGCAAHPHDVRHVGDDRLRAGRDRLGRLPRLCANLADDAAAIAPCQGTILRMNSAARLLAIYDKLTNQPNDQPMVRTWADVFDIDKDGPPALRRRRERVRRSASLRDRFYTAAVGRSRCSGKSDYAGL